MTEMSFLLELLLDHKLPKATKDAIRNRIKDKELSPQAATVYRPARAATNQSPSTQRILDEIASEQGMSPQEPMPEMSVAPVSMPAVIAQTPAAAMALAQRNEAIRIATSGVEEKGRRSPRKF